MITDNYAKLLEDLKTGEINLDAMTQEDLRQFAQVVVSHPNLLRFPHSVAVAYTLRSYATLKATAMEHRARGDIAEATTLECECEALYSNLPASLQW